MITSSLHSFVNIEQNNVASSVLKAEVYIQQVETVLKGSQSLLAL